MMDQFAQLQEIDRSIFDTKNYNIPKSHQIGTRLSENFKKFGSNYSQLTVVIMLLGGLTNLTFLIFLGISCSLWIMLMRNESLIHAIPGCGMSDDQKKVALFIMNVIIMYILCGHSIFTYIGVGFMISFFHAFLFKSLSTSDTVEDPSQYKQFGNVELNIK